MKRRKIEFIISSSTLLFIGVIICLIFFDNSPQIQYGGAECGYGRELDDGKNTNKLRFDVSYIDGKLHVEPHYFVKDRGFTACLCVIPVSVSGVEHWIKNVDKDKDYQNMSSYSTHFWGMNETEKIKIFYFISKKYKVDVKINLPNGKSEELYLLQGGNAFQFYVDEKDKVRYISIHKH